MKIYDNGTVRDMTTDEIAERERILAEMPAPSEPAPPTLDERVGALETSAAEMSEALNMILTGVVE